MLRASIMLRRNTSTALAMVPSSSRRSAPGIVTSISPPERRFMTAVMAASGRDRPRPSSSASRIAPIRMATVPRIRLRCELAAAASYSVVSLMISRRLTGVILDLPEIERGGPACERCVAAQGLAVEHTLELLGAGDHAVAEGRGQLLEILAVIRIDRKVDAEALLGAIDEFLAEGGADVDIGQRLAVSHDRRHAEDRKRLAAGLDADDGLAGLDRLHHGGTPRRSIVVEHLRRMDTVNRGRGRPPERDQRDALRFQRLQGLAKQLAQSVAIILCNGLGDRRHGCEQGRDRQRGAAFIVNGGDHAVILQLQLLIERELRQRTLLDDREGSKNAAGEGHRQRNGEDQANGDRANLEHETFGSSGRRWGGDVP